MNGEMREMSPEQEAQQLAKEISDGWLEAVGPKGESLSQISAELKALQSTREEDDPAKRIENSRRERDLFLVMETPAIQEKVASLQAKKKELESLRVGIEMSKELKDLAELSDEINKAHKEAEELDLAA
jgi:hypothetical protein